MREEDKVVIEYGGLLHDRHMHAAHKLLREQFPHLHGLQSTLLSQVGGFETVRSEGKGKVVGTITFMSSRHTNNTNN